MSCGVLWSLPEPAEFVSRLIYSWLVYLASEVLTHAWGRRGKPRGGSLQTVIGRGQITKPWCFYLQNFTMEYISLILPSPLSSSLFPYCLLFWMFPFSAVLSRFCSGLWHEQFLAFGYPGILATIEPTNLGVTGHGKAWLHTLCNSQSASKYFFPAILHGGLPHYM